MKSYLSILLLVCACTMAAQETAVLDSTDVFFRHIELKQVVVTGPTGAVKLQDMSMPAGIVDRNRLRMTPATNIVDAVAKLPGVEIHQRDEANLRFVAVIEADSIQQESDLFSKIRFLPEVADAALVVHRAEGEQAPAALS